MKLQEGVTFHGGEDFTAEDVKWTVDYVMNPETESPNATFLSQVDTVEVLDPLTVRFNLKRPWAAMPADLSTIQIYSKTATNDSIATSRMAPVRSCGRSGSRATTSHSTKNPNYWHTGSAVISTRSSSARSRKRRPASR